MKNALNTEKLRQNLGSLLQSFVDKGEASGVCAAVIRGEETVFSGNFGFRDKESKLPVDEKTIFRIYSVSKVFTSIALMTLYEKGLFKLYDDVGDYIPSFKNKTVIVPHSISRPTIEPAKRCVRIRDLFTMTSGIPYPGEGHPAEIEMGRLQEKAAADAKAGNPWSTEKMVDEVGKLPLSFHPGEHWLYGFSIDILGRLIEVFSGKKLSEYIKETILDPLGMEDTGFYVPADKQNRLAVMYEETEPGRMTPLHTPLYEEKYFSPPAFESGGGGMVSTLSDLCKFVTMLKNGGSYQGKTIIGRKTIDLIKTNHLTPEQLADYNSDHVRGYGYGLAVRVMMNPEVADLNGSVGEWGWDGMPGNWMCVDPAEDLAAVYLVQRIRGAHYRFIPKIISCIYGSLE